MQKYFCDVSKEQVEIGDLYTIEIKEKLSGKIAFARRDISAFVKADIEKHIAEITVSE